MKSAPPAAAESGAEVEKPWDVRILELIDPGIDETLIDENLKRTPTERLERMQQMVRFLEEARRDRDPTTR